MQNNSQNNGPLKDIRVVEMGQLIAGPFCGQLLGDMGADVVKIEPPEGDPMRDWGQGKIPTWFRVIGRNKSSIALNLRTPEGIATTKELISKADILIENFRPGTLEKWGLDPKKLLEEFPGLIIVRVSGYGQTGPYSGRPGFGMIGEAMGGWRGIVGYPDRPPVRMGNSIGDTLSATYACMGALAALHHKEKTGEGQIIDSALYESVLQVMESMVPEYQINNHKRKRTGSILPLIAPSNVYPCKDGEYLIGGNGDAIWARMAKAMGRPELAEDPRYKTHNARGENQTELDNIISAWTKTLTVDELEALMVEAAVPAGRIFDAEEMLRDPHYKAREAIIEVNDPEVGMTKMQGIFPKMSKTQGTVRKAAPNKPGQDTADILKRWLGR